MNSNPLPMEPVTIGQPVNPVAAAAAYARSSLVDVAHKLVYRRIRSRSRVSSDYDQGQWHQELSARGWEGVSTLDDYILHKHAPVMRAIVNGRLTRVPAHDYYTYRTRLLTNVLARWAGDTDCLVELGSGTGRNLFTLAQTGRWPQLVGLELSSVGRQVTKSIAQHFSIHVESEHIDLLDRTSAGFGRLKGAVAFSFYCLEQLPAHTGEVLDNLAAAGVRRVIHIEPTLELFHWWSLKDLATIMYVWRQDYQRTLLRSVQARVAAGKAALLDVHRLHFAPTCRNEPTLIVWEPRA